MNTPFLSLSLCGVNLLQLQYDQIEGWFVVLLGFVTKWLSDHQVINCYEASGVAALLVGWFHKFLRNDTTGYVTQLAGFIQKRLGKTPPSLPPAAKATLLLLCIIPAALLQHGCTTLNNAAAGVPTSTVQNAARFVQAETQDAVASYVAHHPNYKGDFVIAGHALNTFLATGSTDPSALRTAILADIPAADQTDFAPLVDAAVGAYSLYATDWVQKETSGAFAADAKILLQAIANGLNAAVSPSSAPSGQLPAQAPGLNAATN
jgi:hypothetical protein